MKIILANPSYRPATGAITERFVELAEYLAGAGHDVRVLCWKGGAPEQTAGEQPINGVKVTRIQIGKLGARIRLLGLISTAAAVARAALSKRFDADVVITVAPPLPLGWFGWLHSAFRRGRSRHVVWLMDLETSRPRDDHSLQNTVRDLARPILLGPLRKASLVIPIGRCMEDTLLKGRFDQRKIAVVPIWSNRSHIAPISRDQSIFASDKELHDKFVILYSGRAARYHEFETVCQAMNLLREQKDVAFVFAASDVGMTYVREYASRHRLPNFYERPGVDLSDLGAFLGGGDLHLVTLRDDMVGTCVPSKTYGAFAAGRPVAFIGPPGCEAALNIVEGEAGGVFQTGDAAAFVDEILRWRDRGPAYRSACENAYRAFQSNHSAEVGCARILSALEPAEG